MAFELPQPVPEVVEQRPAVDVEGVLRQLATLQVASVHNQQELNMRISELSSKVDTLISVATNIKSTADAQPAAGIPEDDPEVEVLGRRIDEAIAVLSGARNPGFDPVTSNTPDPNAPV